MLDTEATCDLAFELRADERRISALYASLKQEKEKREEILNAMDKIVDRAVEDARKGE